MNNTCYFLFKKAVWFVLLEKKECVYQFQDLFCMPLAKFLVRDRGEEIFRRLLSQKLK